MELLELPLDRLREAPWNPNLASSGIMARLRASVEKYGIVENLVVRPIGGAYEVISGNQRLKVCLELDLKTAPCVIVYLSDARAKLLAQVLNRTRGEDDLALKAEMVRSVLESLPEEEVLTLLPDTAGGLQALASLGQQSLAEHLRAWEAAQSARLRHLTFQLTSSQLQVVEEALERLLPMVEVDAENPNRRGRALYLLSLDYIERAAEPECITRREES